ncbi:hypothetical protein BMT54_07600 [Pasteurellaceae bacterium 15-036681]|nr:hypothetical protein BMT54_07600 [Pasteurellaceae bacterium 15-036681]
MKKTFIYSTIATAVMLAITPAMANETANSDVAVLDEVSVVGSVAKAGKVNYIAPRSVNVITEDKLADKAVHQLDEALRYEAGVNTQMYGSDLDTNDWFNIRGLGASVRVDGTSSYKNAYFGWEPNIYGLEAVEIVKGADSLTYGSAQTGGLVNLISKRPTKEPKGEIKATFGNRAERGIAGDLSNVINDTMRYRLVGSYNYRQGEQNKTYLENYYFAPSFAWDISDKTNLTLLASVQKDVGVPTTAFFPPYHIVKKYNIDRRTNYGEFDGNYLNRKQYSVGYEFTHKFANDLTFSQNYRFAQADKDQYVTYYYGMTWDPATKGASDTLAKKGFLYANGKTKTHTIDNRISKEWKSDRISNTLTGGLDYQHSNVNGVYDFPWPSADYNVTELVTTGVSRTDVPVYQDKQRQLGLYLQNQFRLDDKLTVTGGIRRDFVKGYSDIRGTKSENRVNHTTYSAGVMYMTDAGIAPYFSYSESFRPLSGSLDNASNSSTIYKPYEGTQYEVGFKYLPSFVDGQISVAYFDLKEKNALVAGRSGDVTSMAQVEKQKNRGVEVQADLNITESLSASLAYSYVFAQTYQLDKERADTPLQPNHTYSAFLNYAFKNNALEGLTLGAGVRYTGTNPTEIDGYNNANIRVPARTLVDLTAKYSLSPNWETRVNISNLADKKYISGCSYACFYGEGRKVTANVSYKF